MVTNWKSYIVCILLGLTRSTVDCYKILGIFTIPGKSHFNFNNAIMKSLANAGHQVVVISPFPNQPPMKNYTLIDVSKGMISYISRMSVDEVSNFRVYQAIKFVADVEAQYCNKFMELEEVQEMFQNDEKPFDAIFVELRALHKCFSPLALKWQIPIIGTVTARSISTADKPVGNPRFPSVIVAELSQLKSLNTFYERLMNTWYHLEQDLSTFYFMRTKGLQFYKDHQKVLVPYRDYEQLNPSLVFYNSHFTLFPRPTSPNAIEIGGIHVDKENPLPLDLQTFLNEGTQGVILFTLGSVVRVSTLSGQLRESFKEAFRQIPQKVIWKFEERMEDVPENVLIQKWIPQRDVLAHRNVKAIISHCGLSGVHEAVHSGKPVIATPLFSDQRTNAGILEKLEVAIILDLTSINKETIIAAINSIINDTRYSENMQELSRRFKDRPTSPQQTVVYWTEYVIRHKGAQHLRTSASELYWYQYLLLDVVVFSIFLVVIFSYIFHWTLRKLKLYIKTLCTDINKKIS